MSAQRITSRTVLERFLNLKEASKKHAESVRSNNTTPHWAELDLHDAAMAYSRAVNRVAKKDRR